MAQSSAVGQSYETKEPFHRNEKKKRTGKDVNMYSYGVLRVNYPDIPVGKF